MGGHPDGSGRRHARPQGAGARRGAATRAATSCRPDPRRSVYGFVDRGDPDEVLNTFDFASPDTPMGKRYETIVPQQALFLMNSPARHRAGPQRRQPRGVSGRRVRRGANPVPVRAVLPASADRGRGAGWAGVRRGVSGVRARTGRHRRRRAAGGAGRRADAAPRRARPGTPRRRTRGQAAAPPGCRSAAGRSTRTRCCSPTRRPS